jgi:hypothetical protein
VVALVQSGSFGSCAWMQQQSERKPSHGSPPLLRVTLVAAEVDFIWDLTFRYLL